MLYLYLKRKGHIKDRQIKDLQRIISSLGMLSLAAGLILKNIVVLKDKSEFATGFFIGLSIALNIIAVYLFRKCKGTAIKN